MLENAQVSCIPIKRMLRESIRLGCAIGALQLESRAPWVGYTAFADCAHDMSDGQTSARRSSYLPAHASLCGMSNGVVRCSQRRKRTSSLTTGALPLGFFGFFGFLTI